MLVCNVDSCVSGEPTLIMPGDDTEMLAGDMATVCNEFRDGFKADAAAVAVVLGGMGVPSGNS